MKGSEFNRKKAAFTIIELLTVMSIIVILITILVPALAKVRHYAKDVKQRSQLHSIEAGLDLFSAELDDYPPSGYYDLAGNPPEPYCGAMKLAEALMGKDLQGYHPAASFLNDPAKAVDASGNPYYPDQDWINGHTAEEYKENLRSRKGPYLQLENANAYRLENLVMGDPARNPGYILTNIVLCDVYNGVWLADADHKLYGKTGMPILYYKANTNDMLHDPNVADTPANIYDYSDNDALVQMFAPSTTTSHPLHEVAGQPWGYKFYEMTRNKKISGNLPASPVRKDSYILWSAGYDGLYGTGDDITNFN